VGQVSKAAGKGKIAVAGGAPVVLGDASDLLGASDGTFIAALDPSAGSRASRAEPSLL
jgi:hypothetical protein